jgi:hypothetical protein
MIRILKERASPAQIQDMLQEYKSMIKIAVDIRRRILAGGGEMQADCESVLLEEGSEQNDLWGANWYPAEKRIDYEALINIRPWLSNRSIVIQNEDIRRQVQAITIELLGGVS